MRILGCFSAQVDSRAKERIADAIKRGSEILILADLGLTTLPSAIWRLTSLKGLNISGNNLRFIPSEIGKLTSLKHLELAFNNLETLPSQIGKLTNLETLSLNNNACKSLPTELGLCTSLKTLHLFNNRDLCALPSSLAQIPELMQLSATGTSVTTDNLHSLLAQWLALQRGPAGHPLKGREWKDRAIQSLDSWVSAGNVDKAKKLIIEAIEREDVEHNELHLVSLYLSTLPPVVWELTSLWRLELSSNMLESIPTEIGNLINLHMLDLFNNRFETLPPEIGKLANLSYLNLRCNSKLNALPPELSLCCNLSFLTVYSCANLHELPMSLGQLPQLVNLEIRLSGITEEMRDSILNQTRYARREGAAEQLPGRLNIWKKMAGVEFDLNGLTTPEKIDLNEWLIRLERTRDFYRSQTRLAGIVARMLKTVSENAEFRELFFVQVAANNECCEDRAAMSLNEIYTSWKSGAEDIKIMTGVAKTLALRSALAKCIPSGERESVEIYLYYETLLKEHLCTAIEEMAYGDIGRREWIDPEQLLKSVNETYFDHLMELPVFKKLVEVKLKSEWERIVNLAQDCPEGEELSEAVLKWQVEVMHERKRAWYECIKRWYDNAVN